MATELKLVSGKICRVSGNPVYTDVQMFMNVSQIDLDDLFLMNVAF